MKGSKEACVRSSFNQPVNLEYIEITVIITTFERPDLLKTSLQSVLSQTTLPLEIIIINDCSEANYQPVLLDFEQHNIKYLCLDKRSGANVARNIGVQAAKGNVIAFLDDDDVWLDIFLENHIQIYLDKPDVGAVVCGHKIMQTPSRINVNPEIYVSANELRHGNRFSGMSGFSAKTSVLRKYPFDPSLKNGQDWDLYVRLVQDQIKFINIPKSLFLYREDTPGSISAKVITMQVSDVEERLQSSIKHRVWLGERFYKKRVSEQVLSLLSHKSNKLAWLRKSIELAGLLATIKTLKQQVMRKLKY